MAPWTQGRGTVQGRRGLEGRLCALLASPDVALSVAPPAGRDAGAAGLGLQPTQDAVYPPKHLGGRPPGEGEKEDPPRVGARGDLVGDAMSQGGGLARAGAGHDQQRVVAVQHRQALLVVQFGKDRPNGSPNGDFNHLELLPPLCILADTGACRITRAAGSGETSPGPESVRARRGYSPGRTDEPAGGGSRVVGPYPARLERRLRGAARSEERQPQLETRPLR